MGAWDKSLERTKGNAGGNTVDLEEAEKLNDKEYVKQLEDIYNKAAGVYMDPALKGMEELKADAQKEQELKIAGVERFKEGIIRDLKKNLSLLEILGIKNLDSYRQMLKNLEGIQIQEQVSEGLEEKLNIARKQVDKLENSINNFLNGKQNDKEKQEAKQPKESKTSDKTIKETGRNTDIVKENEHKTTQKPPIIGNTGIQEKRDKGYDEPMHEEMRKAMRQWSESQENQGTQNEESLKNKDKEKTNLEKEDKDIDEMLRQKWDRMLGL